MDMMKTLLATTAGLALTASAALAENWDMPVAYPDTNYHTDTAKTFAECVATSTGGEITITVHPNGSLFKGNEIKRAVQTGQAPIGERLLSAHENENAIFGFDSVPFLATDFEESQALWEATKPAIEKILDEQNLVLLYSTPWPPQGFYAKKPIEAVGDMQGLKFRSYNTMTARIAELTGMVPVQIEAAELSQALATGVAESMFTSGATGYDSKVWEQLTHFYEVNAWMPRNTVFVNKDVWEGVSDEHKQAVQGCADLAAYAGHWRAVQYTDFTLGQLAENGMTVQPPGEQLDAELTEIGNQMVQEWIDKAGAEGQAIIDEYKAGQN
jgi:TRAP-type C4-dicarboxylate transport system substrate-binding protein